MKQITSSFNNLIWFRTHHHPAIDFLPKTSWSLIGYSASLPCEIEPENPSEQLYTVLWYKDEDGEPIYTYDARSATGNVASPQHWSEQQPRGFGSRARLVISPHPAQLVIANVRQSDAGMYRCRVDFKSAPTRNTLVNVTLLGELWMSVLSCKSLFEMRKAETVFDKVPDNQFI